MLAPIAPAGGLTGTTPTADQQPQPTQSVRDTAPPPPSEPSDGGNNSNNQNDASTNRSADQPSKNNGSRGQTAEPAKEPASQTARSVVESQLLSDDQALMLSRAAQASVQTDVRLDPEMSPVDGLKEATATQTRDRETARTVAMAEEAFAETREINRMAEEKAVTTMRERL